MLLKSDFIPKLAEFNKYQQRFPQKNTGLQSGSLAELYFFIFFKYITKKLKALNLAKFDLLVHIFHFSHH